MSSISEDLHLRINALGSERILQLLDIEQTNRLRLTHAAERTLLYQTHKLGLSSAGTIESGIVTNHAPTIEPPIIPDLSNNQSQQSFTIGVNDPDPTDTHTFTFTSRPGTWVSISNNQLRINPNGRTAGTYNVGLRVTDNGSPQESHDGNLSFRILQANRDPVLGAISPKSIRRHRTLRFSASATDADNDPITYSISNGAKTGMQINSETGQFTWTPGAGQSGGTITIRATDGRGGAHTRNVSITVTEPPAQESLPTIDLITPKSRTGAGRVSFRVRARDPDGLDLSFSADAGSFGTATKQNDGKWTAFYTSPNYTTTGIKTVTITATADGGNPANESTAETVTITVAANRPPVLETIGIQTVRRTQTLEFTLYATDPENNLITYSIESGQKTGMVLGSATGEFSWTPTNSQTTATVVFRATATGGYDEETVVITVNAAPPPAATPPFFTQSTYRHDAVNYSRTKTVRAKDPDKLPIVITARDTPAGFSWLSETKKSTSHQHTAADGWYERTWNDNIGAGTHVFYAKATATGGTPANESKEARITVVRADIDYSPNISITRPINASTLARNFFAAGNIHIYSSYMTISATRYNGEKIPIEDLTVTQNPSFYWPNSQYIFERYRLMNAPLYVDPAWRIGRNGPGALTLTVSYTDTVNNRPYTTTKSITVTIT